MSESTSANLKHYKFADITLDPVRRSVSRGATSINLGKLTYELLLLLVETSPRRLTQAEIAAELWGDRGATPDTIRQRVKLLRDALSDDPERPRYISVVRGQGYRLVPEVDHLHAAAPQSGSTRRRRLVAGLALLVAVPLSLVYWGHAGSVHDAGVQPAPAQSVPFERSIAVLPFENLSSDPDDTYFVDGIHNEILSRLFMIGDLKVISRTSVLAFGNSEKNVREIGRELGVAAVLEGIVQRSDDTVRLSVQLIDARTDEHLWAETYDRELSAKNLLVIQSEMAASIAHALRAEMSPRERARIENVATLSTRAYNFYLIGNDRLRGTNNHTDFSEAAAAFQLAVDEDPEFALAWAGLSRAHSGVYFFVDQSESRHELARQAIERAFELGPELAEAHFAMGYYHYQVLGDYDAALEEWSIAEEGMPGDSRLNLARAYLSRRMGDFEQAAADLNLAIDLDPRNVEQMLLQAGTFARLRDYERAEPFIDRVIEFEPERLLGYVVKAQLPLWASGDVDATHRVLDSAPMEIPAYGLRWTTALYQRDHDAALRYLDSWKFEAIDSLLTYRPRDWFYAITYKSAGMSDLAEPYFLSARTTIARELESRPDDPRVMIALADVLGHLGESARAADLALTALGILSELKDASDVAHAHLNAIIALVAAGDFDAVIRELDLYLTRPAQWSIEGLLPDPSFDPIRNDPRFMALVETYRGR